MKLRNLALLALIIILAGCSTSTPSGNPAFIDQLIEQFENEPVGNPPQSIWSYEYNGQVVYYVPPQCCDQFSSLYDATGNVLCAPDGGLTGKGDERCTDFFSTRINELLIWHDTRTR